MQVDIENISWNQIKSGLLLVHVKSVDEKFWSQMKEFRKALVENCREGVVAFVIAGEDYPTIEVIPESKMNEMGWYKIKQDSDKPIQST